MSSKCGPTAVSSRSPARVGETLRVVRVSNRRPMRDSRPRIVWLNADWETPSCAAAFVKLFSRATARNATMSLRFSRAIGPSCVGLLYPHDLIDEFLSQVRVVCAILSIAPAVVTVHPMNKRKLGKDLEVSAL